MMPPENPSRAIERCAIVVDCELPVGRITNAAAVVALTIGQRHPSLVGEPIIDASGFVHPGLIPVGIPILSASRQELFMVRRKAMDQGCDVVDFPAEGQQTTDYSAFQASVAGIGPDELQYVAVGLIGTKKDVRRATGSLPLLR